MTSSRIAALCRAAALACGLLGGCAAPPPSPASAPAAAVPAPAIVAGRYWEYAVRDAYTGLPQGVYRYTVVRSDADRFVVDVTRNGERIDSHVYAPGWNGIEHPLTNLQRFRFEPAFPAYQFPLYPGQRWRGSVKATDPATGSTYRPHVQAHVGGWHRIRVPAGEFDALEVRRYVYAGNAEFFRLQEEIVQTDWYAPALGYVVASESNSSHVDTSRSGGGRGRPLRVRGAWLIAELVAHGTN